MRVAAVRVQTAAGSPLAFQAAFILGSAGWLAVMRDAAVRVLICSWPARLS